MPPNRVRTQGYTRLGGIHTQLFSPYKLWCETKITPWCGELRQSLVDEAVDILVDKCRGCGLAFEDFDGCFSISCECPRNIFGYCLETRTKAQIDLHIASNQCRI